VVKMDQIIRKLAKILNIAAAGGILAMVVLIVGNILLRRFLKQPILGAYEYVGFLTVLIVGFSLAHCAVLKGHIAIGFVVEKLPVKVQSVFEIVTGILAAFFFGIVSWHLAGYGSRLLASGEVSPTTRTPFHPFVYMISVGMAVLSLVILMQLIKTMREGFQK
jgi:TRAP-type C4-dicarboxylate transport system permease small subunit